MSLRVISSSSKKTNVSPKYNLTYSRPLWQPWERFNAVTQGSSYSVHVELFREQDVGYRELCDVLDASGRKCLLLILG